MAVREDVVGPDHRRGTKFTTHATPPFRQIESRMIANSRSYRGPQHLRECRD
jgi:hypothetical protein